MLGKNSNKTHERWLGPPQAWPHQGLILEPITSPHLPQNTSNRGQEIPALPALKIHSRYPLSSRSICCCLRSFRNARRFSTLSRSLANSLWGEKRGKTHHRQPGQAHSPPSAFQRGFGEPVESRMGVGSGNHSKGLIVVQQIIPLELGCFSASLIPKKTCRIPCARTTASHEIQIIVLNAKSHPPALSTAPSPLEAQEISTFLRRSALPCQPFFKFSQALGDCDKQKPSEKGE